MRDGTKTKRLIDRTALKLFAKKGIKETTIKDIAKMAKIAEGTLYRHYESKDELAEQLFIKNFTSMGSELNSVQRNERTTRTKLLAIIRYFCKAYDKDATVINYMFLARHNHMQKLTPRMPNPYLVFRRVIRQGMIHGDIPRQDTDVATSMVMGIVLQVIDTKILGRRIDRKVSDLADQIGSACLRVLNA